MKLSENIAAPRYVLGVCKMGGYTAWDYYNLGVACSVGQGDIELDLVQAHKWFNLAVMAGMREAQEDRAFIAAEMTSAEIAEAQREARAWLAQDRLPRAA